jgi:CheY-like chemotaxis protein
MTASNGAKTVLVVDDDVDFLEQQKIMLETAGYRVVTAESPPQALELCREDIPDAAVIDLMMEHPDDGFVLCYDLKKEFADLPVIMVTGVAAETGMSFDAATEEQRSWIKADSVLAKPVRFEQLKQEIQRLLKE